MVDCVIRAATIVEFLRLNLSFSSYQLFFPNRAQIIFGPTSGLMFGPKFTGNGYSPGPGVQLTACRGRFVCPKLHPFSGSRPIASKNTGEYTGPGLSSPVFVAKIFLLPKPNVIRPPVRVEPWGKTGPGLSIPLSKPCMVGVFAYSLKIHTCHRFFRVYLSTECAKTMTQNRQKWQIDRRALHSSRAILPEY